MDHRKAVWPAFLVLAVVVSMLAAGSALGAPVTARLLGPAAPSPGGAWTWINPLPQGNDLGTIAGVADPSGDRIWTAGLTQAVYRSLDAGTTWSAVDVAVNQDIPSLSFADTTHGWMVTSDVQGPSVQAKVSFSGDEGATWTEKYAAPDKTFLSAVAAIDADHVVVGGSGGFLATTKDGGTDWSEAQLPGTSPMEVSRLSFTDADTGWALTGSTSVLYATTDGGLTWTEVKDFKADGTDVSGLAAVMPQGAEDAQLWVAGDTGGKGVILRSDDGGTTWEQVDAGDVGKLYSIDMMGSLGLATGTDGQLVVSGDGGASWSLVDAPLAVNIYQGTILADGRGARRRPERARGHQP